jgi:type 1 fimbria pilin
MNAYKKIFAPSLVLLAIALNGTQAFTADSAGTIVFVGHVVESACSVSEQDGAVLFSGCFENRNEPFGATVSMRSGSYQSAAVQRVSVRRSADLFSAPAGSYPRGTIEIAYK